MFQLTDKLDHAEFTGYKTFSYTRINNVSSLQTANRDYILFALLVEKE